MPTLGSQALIRVLPRTHYDFSALRDGVIRVPVAQHIDVLGYDRATLQVRIYSGTLPKQAALQVHLADDGFSADDPSIAFLQTTSAAGEEIGTLQVTDKTVFPFYQSVSTPVPGVFGRLMAVLVSFQGGSGGGPSVMLSMDLLLSGGYVGARIYQPSTYLGYTHEQTEPVETFEPLPLQDTERPAARETNVAARLPDLVDGVLRGDRIADLDGGYPRFGNVNVARGDLGIDGGYPRFGNVNVGRGDLGIDGGYPRFGNVNVARGDLGIDGGYPRFGNVNVGRGDLVSRRLTTAIRDALVLRNLDVATPDGGYARFGNVNVGRGADVRQPNVATEGPDDPEREG